MAKVKVSMTIDGEVLDSFREYCKANGMKISSKVELGMQKVLEDAKHGN